MNTTTITADVSAIRISPAQAKALTRGMDTGIADVSFAKGAAKHRIADALMEKGLVDEELNLTDLARRAVGEANAAVEQAQEDVRQEREAEAAAEPCTPVQDAETTEPEATEAAETTDEPTVELVREPGRGWHHIEMAGRRIGCTYKTTQRGQPRWKAQAGYERTGEDSVYAVATNKADAVRVFIAAFHAAYPLGE